MTQPTPPVPVTAAALTPARRAAALLALALGGFGIGVTEFASMGLLPDVALSLLPGFAEHPSTGIAQAGTIITAYALGVVVGAPLFAVLAARASQTRFALLLLGVFVAGSLASTLAPTFEWLVVFRFAAALPHGAYFGVAAILAARIMGPGNRGRGIALSLSGLTVANVCGVPLATWIGQALGWRWAYGLVAAIFALTLLLVLCFVPRYPGTPERSPLRDLAAFRNYRVWIMIAVASVGFGGFFALYSYIAEVATRIAGLPAGAVPWLLAVMGVGMTIGNLFGGWSADRRPTRTLLVGFGALIVTLLLYVCFASTPAGLFLTTFAVGLAQSTLIPSVQHRFMRVSHEAALLGAAVNHASFNIGNALGAWLGGLVIAAGLGYLAPGWVGVALSVAGMLLALVSIAVTRRDARLSRDTVGIRIPG